MKADQSLNLRSGERGKGKGEGKGRGKWRGIEDSWSKVIRSSLSSRARVKSKRLEEENRISGLKLSGNLGRTLAGYCKSSRRKQNFGYCCTTTRLIEKD